MIDITLNKPCKEIEWLRSRLKMVQEISHEDKCCPKKPSFIGKQVLQIVNHYKLN